jgi:hypothetical protein
VDCAAHAGTPSTQSCAICGRPRCDACLTWDVDGRAACEECGLAEAARLSSAGAALLGFVGVGYLATLAIGYEVFRARPFVGGFAAVVAIALWRILPSFIRLPDAQRRPGRG